MARYRLVTRRHNGWLSLIAALFIGFLTSPVLASTDKNEVNNDKNDELPLDGHYLMAMDTLAGISNDCKCRQHTGTITQPQSYQQQSPATGGARIFYLILVHNVHTLRDAVPLFRAIRDPRHSVVVHVDKKVQVAISKQEKNTTGLQQALQTLQDELESCPCGSRVHLEAVHEVKWSHWSMNLPTLWGMQLAMSEKFKDQWDVFVNLSGDTYPVYTPSTMARIFGKLQNYNFVTSRSCETGLVPTNVYDFPKGWHKRAAYTHQDKIPPPLIHYNDTQGAPSSVTINYYFGSQWVALQPDFVQYLVTEMARFDSFPSRYRDHLMRTGKVMTDETFLPTVLMHAPPFNSTLPKVHTEEGPLKGSVIYDNNKSSGSIVNDELLPPIRALRYERMDEHIPSPLRGYYPEHPRYEVPVNAANVPPTPHTWGPYYLGIYDLADVADSGALFLRKVSSQIDPNLYHLLPVDGYHQIPRIQWPAAGIQVSPVPNWKEEKRQLMRNAIGLAKNEGREVPTHFRQELEALEQEHAQKMEARDEQNANDNPREEQDKEGDGLRATTEIPAASPFKRELQGFESSNKNENEGAENV